MPLPPTEGSCRATAADAVVLTWSRGPHSNVAHFSIDRAIGITNLTVLVTAMTHTSYSDASAQAIAHDDRLGTSGGVSYYIYSVGPTGLRNPLPLAFTVLPTLKAIAPSLAPGSEHARATCEKLSGGPQT